jgi:4'-phosphopantetheinyl transferase
MLPDVPQVQPRSPALHLWYAYPADLADPAIAQACAALLSDDERARAARFRFERGRQEFLCSHALARLALSHRYPLPPQSWSYSFNARGKPSPIPECGLRFNQSDSPGLAVCLTAQHVEVGVDVEAFSRAQQILGLASYVFSTAEQEQLQSVPAASRPARALTLWTLKEGYIKARGMGLALPLRKISFLFGGTEQIHLELDAALNDDPARWRFCLLNHVEHRIALVVDAAAPAIVEILAAHPLFAAPTSLSSAAEAWFPVPATEIPSHAAG